jgi:hypothetical protein
LRALVRVGAGDSPTSLHTSKPLLRKWQPRFFDSSQMVRVSMRQASSMMMSPAASFMSSSSGRSVSRVTTGPGAKEKRPSAEASLISGARYLMALMPCSWPRAMTTASVLYMAWPTEPKPITWIVRPPAGDAEAILLGPREVVVEERN